MFLILIECQLDSKILNSHQFRINASIRKLHIESDFGKFIQIDLLSLYDRAISIIFALVAIADKLYRSHYDVRLSLVTVTTFDTSNYMWISCVTWRIWFGSSNLDESVLLERVRTKWVVVSYVFIPPTHLPLTQLRFKLVIWKHYRCHVHPERSHGRWIP